MKHIFTIHSPITFFCAENIVDYEELKSQNVIYLCSGYYPKEAKGRVVPSVSDMAKTTWQKILSFNLAKASDAYIDDLYEGDKFKAYIDLAHYYQKLLITHIDCVAFNLMEEGTASYLSPKELVELTRIESVNRVRLMTFARVEFCFSGLRMLL